MTNKRKRSNLKKFLIEFTYPEYDQIVVEAEDDIEATEMAQDLIDPEAEIAEVTPMDEDDGEDYD